MKTLTKEHGLLSVDQTNPREWEINTSISNGWERVGLGAFVSSTYFDLAGMSMEEKTLFFEAAGTQDLLAPQVFNQATGDSLILLDIMTSSPMTANEVVFFGIFGNFSGSPSHLSFDETIYERAQQYSVHVDTGLWNGMTLNTENQLGSMKPTASDRVYSYRAVLFGTPFTGDRVDLTGCRHILQAKAKEESDHEYLMRLMRSYQLQQEPDVD